MNEVIVYLPEFDVIGVIGAGYFAVGEDDVIRFKDIKLAATFFELSVPLFTDMIVIGEV